jgi:hypothetical protein
MKVLGVEFAANNMNYVVIERNDAGKVTLQSANRFSLSETRSGDCLRAFQGAIQTLLKDTAPDLVAVKDKPEKGAMQAGAAALKMEGILLANASCEIRFISGTRINKCSDPKMPLKAYHHAAFKAAACVISDE